MRSIAYGQRLKDAREFSICDTSAEEGGNQLEPVSETDIERWAIERQAVEKIREAFADKPEVLTFLDLLMADDPGEVKKVVGPRLFRSLVSLISRELVRQFPDLEVQMRTRRNQAARSKSVGIRVFTCASCRGKVVRARVGGGHLRWTCEVCNASYGPPWAEAESQFETRLIGLDIWTDEVKAPDPVEVVKVEFRETRNGEGWMVWAEKSGGTWTFWEQPVTEVRKSQPVKFAIPRLIECAERILLRAAGVDEADERLVGDYVRCIVQNNLSRLSDQLPSGWTAI